MVVTLQQGIDNGIGFFADNMRKCGGKKSDFCMNHYISMQIIFKLASEGSGIGG